MIKLNRTVDITYSPFTCEVDILVVTNTLTINQTLVNATLDCDAYGCYDACDAYGC